MSKDKSILDPLEEKAIELIKKNKHTEYMIKASLEGLTDQKNIKKITSTFSTSYFTNYSYDAIGVMQDKVKNKIVAILYIEKHLSKDMLYKYSLDGYIQARNIFANDSYYKKHYHNSLFFYNDKKIMFQTLYKYDKRTLFKYGLNTYKYHIGLSALLIGTACLLKKRQR